MRNNSIGGFVVGGLFMIPAIIWCVINWVNAINFDVGCEGHLKRAADANTIELAEEELKSALDYMESKNLTSGTTQVIIPSPSKDIGFWYRNVKACYDDLQRVNESDRQRNEVVNTSLLKLRESLLDHGTKGETVTVPPDIHNYPGVVGMFVLMVTGIICGIIGFFLCVWSLDH